MNTTTAAHTADTLDRMASDPRWLGFGYLGERHNALDPESPSSSELVARMDADVLEEARIEGLTYDELFAWANSKDGRWFADCYGTHHAANYLPSRTRFARYGL